MASMATPLRGSSVSVSCDFGLEMRRAMHARPNHVHAYRPIVMIADETSKWPLAIKQLQ